MSVPQAWIIVVHTLNLWFHIFIYILCTIQKITITQIYHFKDFNPDVSVRSQTLSALGMDRHDSVILIPSKLTFVCVMAHVEMWAVLVSHNEGSYTFVNVPCAILEGKPRQRLVLNGRKLYQRSVHMLSFCLRNFSLASIIYSFLFQAFAWSASTEYYKSCQH